MSEYRSAVASVEFLNQCAHRSSRADDTAETRGCVDDRGDGPPEDLLASAPALDTTALPSGGRASAGLYLVLVTLLADTAWIEACPVPLCISDITDIVAEVRAQFPDAQPTPAPLGGAVLDLFGRMQILAGNTALAELVGTFAPGDFLAGYEQRFDPDALEKVWRTFVAFSNGAAEHRMELSVRTAALAHLELILVLRRIRYSLPDAAVDDRVLVAVAFLDVTKERVTERRLKELARVHALAEEVAKFGMWRRSAESDEVWTSTGLKRLTGLSDDDPRAKTRSGFFSMAHPDDRAMLLETVTRHNASHVPTTGAFRIVRDDGEIRHIQFSVVFDTASTKENPTVFGVVRDVTNEVAAEQERLENAELAAEVRARDNERREIARDLHDETGQLVAAISFGVETIRGAKSLKDAKSTATRIARLVDTVSAQVSSTARTLHPEHIDTVDLCGALREFAETWEASSQRRISVGCSDDCRHDFPDSVKKCLFGVAREAIRNAVRHSKARDVTVSIRREDNSVILSVADDGIGFDSSSPLRPGDPAGIGISCMKDRVAELGGELTIDSKAVQGTTVTARVPLGA